MIQLSDSFTYKRLIKFTLPTIFTMVLTSIYSIVDGFFVSNFAGKTPFSAVNLIMPFLTILGTVGFMFGSGGTAIVSNTYGAGDREKANRYFSLFVYVAFGIGVILAVLGIIFIEPIARFLGADGAMLENCIIYGRTILVALPFLILQFLFQSFLVAAEKPRMGLCIAISAGLTNMILDAVLVIGLPQEYKLFGAALATMTSQIVGGLVPLIFFIRPNDSILRLGKTSFDGKALVKACTNGSSEFMSNVSMSIVGMIYNTQLMHYAGENGVAAYGAIMYVSMIFSAAFIGYSIGTAPIIGFHNGAQNHREVKSILIKSLKMIGLCGLTMLLLSQVLARPLAAIFVGYDAELMEITVHGFKIFALSFFFMGFGIYGSSFFTALNNGLISALISFLRALVFQGGSVLILPTILGIDGIWWAIVVAEVMAVIMTSFFLILNQKKYQY